MESVQLNELHAFLVFWQYTIILLSLRNYYKHLYLICISKLQQIMCETMGRKIISNNNIEILVCLVQSIRQCGSVLYAEKNSSHGLWSLGIARQNVPKQLGNANMMKKSVSWNYMCRYMGLDVHILCHLYAHTL